MSFTKMDPPPLVCGIDQGTSNTKVCVFDSNTGEVLASSSIETKRIEPNEGWTEMDPLYVLETVVNGIEIVAQQLKDKNISIKQVKCLGITNQMLTFLSWSKKNRQTFLQRY